MNYEDRVTKQYIEDAIAGAGARVVAGTYTGTYLQSGVDPGQEIVLGFRPKAVIIFPNSESYCEGYYHSAMVLDGSPNNSAEITSNGFIAKNETNYAYKSHVSASRCNPYRYIAFG